MGRPLTLSSYFPLSVSPSLFPSAPFSLRLPARIRRGSHWLACGIFPTAQTSKHMFMIMGWINIGAKNHKRAGKKTESRKTEMKRRRGIFLIKLFLNPSVSLLHYLLLCSPSQPVVIERAETQYGGCVSRRCLCVCEHVWKRTGVLRPIVLSQVSRQWLPPPPFKAFEAIFLSCEILLNSLLKNH